jgi:hypothetical protein
LLSGKRRGRSDFIRESIEAQVRKQEMGRPVRQVIEGYERIPDDPEQFAFAEEALGWVSAEGSSHHI